MASISTFSSILLIVCIFFITTSDAAPPGQPALPPCPQDFVSKFNNASLACEDEGVEALMANPETATVKAIYAHTAASKNLFKRFRRAAASPAPIITSNLTAINNTSPSNMSSNNNATKTTVKPDKQEKPDFETSSEEEEEADPEIMLCTFERLKAVVPQLDIIEKQCTMQNTGSGGPNQAPAGGTTTTTTTARPKDDLDAELQLASCLEEKLETMCPELSSVA